MMVVTFTKVDGGRVCRWEAVRSKRRRTAGHMGVGHDRLPHDLAGFAAESRLGLERGFWGLVEMGATFKSLSRKRTKPGRSIIRENVTTLDEAEHLAGLHWRRWHEGEETPAASGLRLAPRGVAGASGRGEHQPRVAKRARRVGLQRATPRPRVRQ